MLVLMMPLIATGTFDCFAQDQDLKKLNEEFKAFEKKQTEDFQAFADSVNRDFANFLKQEWESFRAFAGDPVPEEKPKPPDQPRKEEEPVKEKPKAEKPEAPKPPPIPEVKEEPEDPQPKEPEKTPKPIPERKLNKEASFDYYGVPVNFYYELAFQKPPADYGPEGIANYWLSMIESNYEEFLGDLLNMKEELNLNDWGYFKLIDEQVDRILFAKDQNHKNALSWFLMNQSGYRCRLGLVGESVVLLMPSKQPIFEVPYLVVDELKYYVINFKGEAKEFQSYNLEYKFAIHPLDLSLPTLPKLSGTSTTRNVRFSFNDVQYSYRIVYNKGLVAFYDEMPSVGLDITLGSPPSLSLASSLRTLRQDLARMGQRMAVDFLLRLVQTGFEYQLDDEQFGREKYLFAEEVLHYPYSDCEDRTALFVALIRELLGLDVIGLRFPGHVCAAVRFTEEHNGDHLVYNGQKYTISDPTYIGAPSGMTMPEHKNAKVEIIEF